LPGLGDGTDLNLDRTMTLCPIALAVGCKKCPIYSVCPVKTLIGDVPPAERKPPPEAAKRTRKKT
jgi:hypothetical protein